MWLPIRFLPVLIVGILTTYTLLQTRGMSVQIPTVLGAVLTILIVISSLLSLRRVKRIMSSSQDYGHEMTFILSENGMHAAYPDWDCQLKWSAFTQAAFFDDGVLLMQGPGGYWMLYQSIEGDYGQERLIHLLQANIPKIIDRRKNKNN